MGVQTEWVNVAGRNVRMYLIDGKRYPSVTTILKFLPESDSLKRWKRKPTAADDSRRAAVVGTVTHWRASQYWAKHFGLPPSTLVIDGDRSLKPEDHEKIAVKYSYFLDFVEEYHPEPVRIEFTVHHDELEYAGTCDGALKIDDAICLYDIKSQLTVYKSYKAQLAAYKHAIEETMHLFDVDKLAVLSLSDKGWKFHENVKPEWELFKEALDLYNQARRG